MCGIIGFQQKGQDLVSVSKKLMASLKHRGPDSEGVYILDNVCLAHVRLSLIDLTTGYQPMEYEDLVITYNGEIYNYKELRNYLIDCGYSFETSSDTEVLLKLYHLEGDQFIEKLNGIYSFAIYNKTTEEFILSRDFFGVKPFYYYITDEAFIFASEIKTILSYLKIINAKIDINNDALTEYLIKGFIREHEIIKGIKSLETGRLFKFNKGILQQSFVIQENNVLLCNVKPNVENILREQVNLELEADVEIGILLSGGIDSSLLTALAVQNKKEKIKTFSIGFKESSIYDESVYSRYVAQNLGTEHHEYLFTEKDLLGEIDSLVDCLDQPLYDPAMLPMLFLSKKVKGVVKAALSGDGGDELFGGYIKYRIFKYRKLLKIFTFFSPLIEPIIPKIKVLNSLLRNIGLPTGPFSMDRSLLANIEPVEKKIFKSFKELMEHDILEELKYKMLVKTDLTSMYNGLEVRVPFLNRKLYAVAKGLPDHQLISLFYGKKVLRKILSKSLPKDIFNKKKVGFRVPIFEWIRDGELGLLVEKNLLQNNHIPEEVISKKSITELLKKKNESIHATQIFSLYILNRWIIKFHNI